MTTNKYSFGTSKSHFEGKRKVLSKIFLEVKNMIKVAILGTGKIIPEAIEAIQTSKKFDISVIWGRSEEKAKILAEKYKIDRVTTNLEEILKDTTIDFAYIGLVNSVHYEYAKKILESGKNVIVEKPFTTNYDEAKNLYKLAISKKLYIFEAITNIHTPNFKILQEFLKKIGEIKFIQANYSQYSSRYDDYKIGKVAPAFDKNMQGGALRDLNVYNINLVAKLFGLPKNVKYLKNLGFNGVDTSGILILEYEKFIASCVAAKDSASPSYFLIQGDNGYIKVDSAPNIFKNVEIKIRGEELKKFDKNEYENRMVHEFIDFGKIFEENNYKEMEDYLRNSLEVMKIISESD